MWSANAGARDFWMECLHDRCALEYGSEENGHHHEVVKNEQADDEHAQIFKRPSQIKKENKNCIFNEG